MKIGSISNNVIPLNSGVRSKRGQGDGGAAGQQYDPNQTRKDSSDEQGQDQPKREKQATFDPQLIDDALKSFQADEATLSQGLSAELEGTGPGLKVSVKDCNGTTVRQFTGEEFLRLREVANPQAGLTTAYAKRGKILDQKL